MCHSEVYYLGKLEFVVDQHEFVGTLAFNLILVVGLRGYSSRQEYPLFEVIGPLNGLVDASVARRLCTEDGTYEIVRFGPVDAAKFTAGGKNGNPEIVGVGDGTIRFRVLLTHGTHVEFATQSPTPISYPCQCHWHLLLFRNEERQRIPYR